MSKDALRTKQVIVLGYWDREIARFGAKLITPEECRRRCYRTTPNGG